MVDLQKQPLVSVVTPVYNGEKYLAECIESVLAQTYQNWEYVIVNNCSKDRTAEIVQYYAQQDARIRLHNNKDFLDIIQNWNHALRQISPESKYCKEVHADDLLLPECIAKMVEVAEAHPTVGLVGAYRLHGDRVDLDRLPYPSTFVSGREICRNWLMGGPFLFGSPTSLLVRADLIPEYENFYNEDYFHADTEVCCNVLQKSDFGFVHQVLSYTRMHDDSMTTSFTEKFNSTKPAFLNILKKYGPIYLSDQEYEKSLQSMLYWYYKFLAESVFERKGKEFWDYHTQELKNMGEPLNRLRLIKASFLHLLFDRTLGPALTTTQNILQNFPGNIWWRKTV